MREGFLRANFRLMHYVFWELRLRRVQAQHFKPAALRFLVKTGSVVRLAALFLRLKLLSRKALDG